MPPCCAGLALPITTFRGGSILSMLLVMLPVTSVVLTLVLNLRLPR